MIGRPKFVLASGSPRRLALVNQAGIEPDALKPADVDETPKRGEIPRAYANRLARSKAAAALDNVKLDDELRGAYILAADTVVAVGRRILPKAELLDEAAQCLRLLSGRNHRVYTSICLVTPKEAFRQRLVETRVRFKRLSEEDIESYLASGEWRGKAGGYAAQGIAGSFMVKLVGSYSQCGRPAALRDHGAARRRGLSDPLRLAQRRVTLSMRWRRMNIASWLARVGPQPSGPAGGGVAARAWSRPTGELADARGAARRRLAHAVQARARRPRRHRRQEFTGLSRAALRHLARRSCGGAGQCQAARRRARLHSGAFRRASLLRLGRARRRDRAACAAKPSSG